MTKKVLFIGAGRMAQAIIEGIRNGDQFAIHRLIREAIDACREKAKDLARFNG